MTMTMTMTMIMTITMTIAMAMTSFVAATATGTAETFEATTTAVLQREEGGGVRLHVLVSEFITNNRYYIYLLEDVLPSSTILNSIRTFIEVWYYRLDVPEFNIYQLAVKECTKDIIKSCDSTYKLGYLTLKPFFLLLLIMIQNVFQFVSEHGGRSLQKGAIQTKYAIIWLYHFQLSLNRTQLVGELGVLLFCIGLYYFRLWLKRQTYWSRLNRWYKVRKQRFFKSYTEAVHKIARVSKILAMALPHIIFIGICVGVRIGFPNLVQYITYETPIVVLLSVWYPLCSTFVWVNNQRNPNRRCCDNDGDDRRSNSNNIAVTTTKNRGKKATPKEKKKNDSPPPSSVAAFEQNSSVVVVGNVSPNTNTTIETATKAMVTTNYWLNYWHMYGIIQAFGQCFSLIPFIGRFLIHTGEFKLFFFLWVFGMERVLGNTSKDVFLAEALPLRLIKRRITPIVMRLHTLVSDAIPIEVWDRFVVSKTKTILSAFVMIRMLSEEWKEWLVHVAEEARVLIVPSITLLMPGFVTQFGVTYVQYIVPSAKSADAKGDGMKIMYLQYWIMHCAVTGLLSLLGGVLRWIPLSTHMIFLLWSYLVLPQAIRNIYSIFELELFTFGILNRQGRSNNENEDNGDAPPPPVISVSDTKTVKLFKSVLSWLPTASNNNDDDDNSNSSDNQKLADDSSSLGEEDDHDIKKVDNAKTAEVGNREIIAANDTATDENVKEENGDSAPPAGSVNHHDDDDDEVSKPSSLLVSALAE